MCNRQLLHLQNLHKGNRFLQGFSLITIITSLYQPIHKPHTLISSYLPSFLFLHFIYSHHPSIFLFQHLPVDVHLPDLLMFASLRHLALSFCLLTCETYMMVGWCHHLSLLDRRSLPRQRLQLNLNFGLSASADCRVHFARGCHAISGLAAFHLCCSTLLIPCIYYTPGNVHECTISIRFCSQISHDSLWLIL